MGKYLLIQEKRIIARANDLKEAKRLKNNVYMRISNEEITIYKEVK